MNEKIEKKMSKKNRYLLIWTISITVTVVVALIAQALFPTPEDQKSPIYLILCIIVTIAFIVFIVFLVKWKKTCPVCKEGKMSFTGTEKGVSENFTYDAKVSDKVKNKKGEVYKTIERTVEKTGVSTEYTKHYKCNHCGHTREKTFVKTRK